MVNVQTLSREIGLPFVNVSMNFVSFFKFLNKIGLIETEKCTNEVFDYCQDIIKQHEFKGMGVIVTVDYIFLVHDRKAFFCFGRNRNKPKQPCFFSAETETETENVFLFRPKPIPKPKLQCFNHLFNKGVCGTSWQLKNAQKTFLNTNFA